MDIIKNNAFIVAEYNPFHNGHKYHIEKTKAAGAENIICIMNGNFVQRGEPGICDKLLRAEAAIKNGADLVLELPLKYGISPANLFAFGAVQTAVCTGLDGTFSFGCTSSADKLEKICEITQKDNVALKVNDISQKTGKTYPAAMQELFLEAYPDYASVWSDANNTLGIEYIKAIRASGAAFDWFTVDRSQSALHDAACPVNNIASAKYLRELMMGNEVEKTEYYIPSSAFTLIRSAFLSGKCTENHRHFSDVCLSRLYSCKANFFAGINGVSQGLENRIAECVKEIASLEELYDNVKTKRFTHARIRQIILASVLGVTRSDLAAGVNYIRVLGFNDKGRELLKEMRTKAKTPVITNLSDINNDSSFQAQRDKELDIFAGKLYELCRTIPQSGNTEIQLKPYFEL